jgi:hypothetical protein
MGGSYLLAVRTIPVGYVPTNGELAKLFFSGEVPEEDQEQLENARNRGWANWPPLRYKSVMVAIEMPCCVLSVTVVQGKKSHFGFINSLGV